MKTVRSIIFNLIPCLALIPCRHKKISFELTVTNPLDFDIEIHSNSLITEKLPAYNYKTVKGEVNSPKGIYLWATKAGDNNALGAGMVNFKPNYNEKLSWIAGNKLVVGEKDYITAYNLQTSGL